MSFLLVVLLFAFLLAIISFLLRRRFVFAFHTTGDAVRRELRSNLAASFDVYCGRALCISRLTGVSPPRGCQRLFRSPAGLTLLTILGEKRGCSAI